MSGYSDDHALSRCVGSWTIAAVCAAALVFLSGCDSPQLQVGGVAETAERAVASKMDTPEKETVRVETGWLIKAVNVGDHVAQYGESGKAIVLIYSGMPSKDAFVVTSVRRWFESAREGGNTVSEVLLFYYPPTKGAQFSFLGITFEVVSATPTTLTVRYQAGKGR